MFYALATRKIRTGNLSFVHVLEDIQTLNQKALEGTYDITAISFHAYPYLGNRYLLLPCGASFGDRFGPVVVARGSLGPNGLKGKRVAVPGNLTTAYLLLRLVEADIEPLFVPFDQVFDRVASGEADAGVAIHEGQLTYTQAGLTRVMDVGDWWYQETQLPLPLGANVIRRALPQQLQLEVARILRESIQYAFEHREEALEYASQFARGLDQPTTDRFVSMYVNDWTLDYGDVGRRAIETLFHRAAQRGLIPGFVKAEFVE